MNSKKLRQAQKAEFRLYCKYPSEPRKQPLSIESTTSMPCYGENEGLLYRSYIPGHLRKRRTFRGQLVIPSACIPMLLHVCHDHAVSSVHLAYKHMFDNMRDRSWWPTFHHDVKLGAMPAKHANGVKYRIRRAKLPTGHLPVGRLFQCFSIDLVKYKWKAVSQTGL